VRRYSSSPAGTYAAAQANGRRAWRRSSRVYVTAAWHYVHSIVSLSPCYYTGRRSWSVEEAIHRLIIFLLWHSHLGLFLAIRECRYTPRAQGKLLGLQTASCFVWQPIPPGLASVFCSAGQMPYEYKLASYKYSPPLMAGCVTDLHRGGTPFPETVMSALAQQSHRKRYQILQNTPKNLNKHK
jgi:hypothetical protein